MLKSNHIDCGNNEKRCFQYVVREDSKGLKSNPYCILYNTVKNMGSDRAKRIGYFINVVSNIENCLKLPGYIVRMHLITIRKKQS